MLRLTRLSSRSVALANCRLPLAVRPPLGVWGWGNGVLASVRGPGTPVSTGCCRATAGAGGRITYSTPGRGGATMAAATSSTSTATAARRSSDGFAAADRRRSSRRPRGARRRLRPAAAGFSVEGFTGLAVTYAGAGSGAGDIRVAQHRRRADLLRLSSPAAAWAATSGSAASGRAPQAGNYDHLTMLHEVGHALGLKHAHEAGGFGAVPLGLRHARVHGDDLPALGRAARRRATTSRSGARRRPT